MDNGEQETLTQTKMNTEAEQQLLHHARNGNAEEVRKLLEAMERTEVIAAIDCKAVERTQQRKLEELLLGAAREGRTAEVSALLSRPNPPDVNCSDQLGNTPLHCAAYRAHKQCALKLLKSGADPNLKNKNASNALPTSNETRAYEDNQGNDRPDAVRNTYRQGCKHLTQAVCTKWLEAIEEHSAYSTHYCSQDQVTDEEEEDAVSPMDLKESLKRAQTCQQRLDREIYNFLKMIKECDVAKENLRVVLSFVPVLVCSSVPILPCLVEQSSITETCLELDL
ncbi:hypothetical protein NN561_012566 [Cricetulus griseus]